MEPDYIISDLWPLVVGMDEVGVDATNAMGHDEVNLDQIAGSLRKHKQRKPIVINRATGVIEAGNGTWLAARRLGWRYIAVVGEDDDAQTAVSYGIADNAVASQAWDWERLKKHLDTFEDTGEVPGVDEGLLERLRVGLEEEGSRGAGEQGGGGEGGPDKAAELQQAYGTEVGQVWRLGRHRLAVGDCTDRGVVEGVMGGERASLFLTDPPYGVSYADKNRFLNTLAKGNAVQKPIENDHETMDDMCKLWREAATRACEITTNQAAYYWFACQGGDQMMMMMMMIGEAGWLVRHELIWLKNNHVLGRSDYQYKHEPILYGWKRDGTHKWFGGFQTSVLEFNRPTKSDLHPTTKPVDLVEFLIMNSTQKNEIVYDPFLGSGTTMIAAQQLGRQCRGIELDPGYAAVAIWRWEELTGEKAEKI